MSDSGSGTLTRVTSASAILEAGPVRREVFPFLQATEWVPSFDEARPEPQDVAQRAADAMPVGGSEPDHGDRGAQGNGAGPPEPAAGNRDPETGLPVAGVDFPEPDAAAPGTDIVFEHGLLASVHRRAPREGRTIGVFLGTRCECPWTRRSWIRVTEACAGGPEPGDPAADGDGSADGLRQRLSSALDKCRGAERVVGWYRARPVEGPGEGAMPELSRAERQVHAERFPEPWHFCLLLRSDAPRVELGLFLAGADGGVEGNRPSPLYELASPAGFFKRRPLQARNYRPVSRRREIGAWPRARAVVRWRWPVAAAAAVLVLGAAVGLGLGRELPPDMQPAVGSAGLDFASPLASGEALAVLEARAGDLRGLLPASGGEGASACDGVERGRAAVEAAYLGVKRALGGAPEAGSTLSAAGAIVERIEAEVAASGCAPDRGRPETGGADRAPEPSR